MNFKEYLDEQKLTEGKFKFPKEVKFKNATPKEIKQGENYTIIDIKNKEVLKNNITQASAKEAVQVLNDENILFGSSAFIYDKYISKWG